MIRFRVILRNASRGERFTFGGRPYTVLAVIPTAWKAIIGGRCVVCREPFRHEAPLNPSWIPATCPNHRGQYHKNQNPRQ